MAIFCVALAPVGSLVMVLIKRIPKLPNTIYLGISALLNTFWQAFQQIGLMWTLCSTGLLNLLAMTMTAVVIFWGLGAQIEFYQAALLMAVYKLTHFIILTPGNIGVREWSISGVCALLGINPALGLLFALLLRGIRLIALLSWSVGLYFLFPEQDST